MSFFSIGQTISSGSCAATAASIACAESTTATVTSCPSSVSAIQARWLRLLWAETRNSTRSEPDKSDRPPGDRSDRLHERTVGGRDPSRGPLLHAADVALDDLLEHRVDGRPRKRGQRVTERDHPVHLDPDRRGDGVWVALVPGAQAAGDRAHEVVEGGVAERGVDPARALVVTRTEDRRVLARALEREREVGVAHGEQLRVRIALVGALGRVQVAAQLSERAVEDRGQKLLDA